jgi:hypothetical protein
MATTTQTLDQLRSRYLNTAMSRQMGEQYQADQTGRTAYNFGFAPDVNYDTAKVTFEPLANDYLRTQSFDGDNMVRDVTEYNAPDNLMKSFLTDAAMMAAAGFGAHALLGGGGLMGLGAAEAGAGVGGAAGAGGATNAALIESALGTAGYGASSAGAGLGAYSSGAALGGAAANMGATNPALIESALGTSGYGASSAGAGGGAGTGGLFGNLGSQLAGKIGNVPVNKLIGSGLGGLLGGSGATGGPEAYKGPMPTISRGNWKADNQAQLMPQQPQGLLQAPGQGVQNSGLWQYMQNGLLG